MRKAVAIAVMLTLTPFLYPSIFAQELGFYGISNDIAVYKNSDDDFKDKGWTLQLVFINSIKVGTEFQVEFTGDFNQDLAWEGKDDYYIEIGVLKDFYKGLSINYQRIEGTFQSGGINQIGLRYHF